MRILDLLHLDQALRSSIQFVSNSQIFKRLLHNHRLRHVLVFWANIGGALSVKLHFEILTVTGIPRVVLSLREDILNMGTSLFRDLAAHLDFP